MHLGPFSRRRRGVSRGDVVVLILLIGTTALLLMAWTTRGRESARLAGCSRHLSQIGFGLALYDQMHGNLPRTSTTPPSVPPIKGPNGPLKTLLESLDLPDLTALRDAKTPPKGQPGHVSAEVPIPGFICASDPNAISGRLQAPVSYRATTGDTFRGDNGAFAPGRTWSLAAIEQRDGLSYTAAFSERLVGSAGERLDGLSGHRIIPPPLSDTGCPPPVGVSGLRDDAGSSWISSDYRSTLYNHALPPNGSPSCIDDGGRTAYMGASSGHVRGVNLLRLDGSVSLTLPSIAPKVWRELAAISEAPQAEQP
jgi:Protein of unknown function (DUF1559)